jgi:hypothetical protein
MQHIPINMITLRFVLPVPVTVVACRACVRVTRDPSMIGIGVGLVMRMAIDAGKEREIRRNRMAFGAQRPASSVGPAVNLEIIAVVVHRRRDPCRRTVTGGAIVVKICRRMAGICRTRIVCLMTLIAVRVRDPIISIHVA